MNPTILAGNSMPERKRAVVILGCGKTAWEDLDKVGSPLLDCDIMAVNWTIPFYFGKPLVHAVSLHGELLEKWVELRVGLLKDSPAMIHSAMLSPSSKANWIWETPTYPPISGIFAIWIADALNYEKIYLCGMSLEGGYFWAPSHNRRYAPHVEFRQYKTTIPWSKIAYCLPSFKARFQG